MLKGAKSLRSDSPAILGAREKSERYRDGPTSYKRSNSAQKRHMIG